jgi:hypothetical protein
MDPKLYRAFFSYAHHDVLTDGALLTDFTTTLQNQVNARLVGASFVIWRDKEELRTGDRWHAQIETELRSSHILIVLLTPRWIDSDYCRREYSVFEEIEAARKVGDYVAPILVRDIERQEKYLSGDGKDVYERIRSRQYTKVLATDERASVISRISDDIEGMIERLRLADAALPIPTEVFPTSRQVRPRKKKEFDAGALNYERVDFLSDGEVVLKRFRDHRQHDVFVHVSFIERLYVQGQLGRIEFGVRRAYISVASDGPELLKVDELRSGGDCRNIRYVSLRETPRAVTLCIDPPPGKLSLAELPLPPAQNEKLLSKIATAPAEARAAQLNATLIVSLDAEGLYLADDKHQISAKTEAAIKAILGVARAKVAKNETIDRNGFSHRALPVMERQ